MVTQLNLESLTVFDLPSSVSKPPTIDDKLLKRVGPKPNYDTTNADETPDGDDSSRYQRVHASRKVIGNDGAREGRYNRFDTTSKLPKHYENKKADRVEIEEESPKRTENRRQPGRSHEDFHEVARAALTRAVLATGDHVPEEERYEFVSYINMHHLGRVLLAYILATASIRTQNVNFTLQNTLNYN